MLCLCVSVYTSVWVGYHSCRWTGRDNTWLVFGTRITPQRARRLADDDCVVSGLNGGVVFLVQPKIYLKRQYEKNVILVTNDWFGRNILIHKHAVSLASLLQFSLKIRSLSKENIMWSLWPDPPSLRFSPIMLVLFFLYWGNVVKHYDWSDTMYVWVSVCVCVCLCLYMSGAQHTVVLNCKILL